MYVHLPASEIAAGGTMSIASSVEPILTITSTAQGITFAGLHVGYTYGDGIVVQDGAKDIALVGCRIHDVGGDAVTLAAAGSVVRSSYVFRTGCGGVIVTANDNSAWKDLRPSKISVINNHIYDIGYRGIAFGIGVSLCNGTTGALVTHNLIHHVAGKGTYGGHRTSSGYGSTYKSSGQFDNVISLNEIFQVGLNGSGIAAMYSCCGQYFPKFYLAFTP